MHCFPHLPGTDQRLTVVTRGPVSGPDIDRGQRLAAASVADAGEVDRSLVKLAEYRTATGSTIGVAQVNVHCAGRLVRAQATGGTAGDAVGPACSILSRRLDRLHRRLARDTAGPPDFTGEDWDRRQCRRIDRLRGDRAPTRRITRYKAYPLALQDADAAALTMDLRDYDFHLFIEATTGEHAVVHRTGPDGYRLRLPRPDLATGLGYTAPVTLDDTPLPRLNLAQAAYLLDADQAGFVAFLSTTTGRGTVLYRRYDGRLAVLTSCW